MSLIRKTLLALGLPILLTMIGFTCPTQAQTLTTSQNAFLSLLQSTLSSPPTGSVFYAAVPCTIGSANCPITGYKIQLVSSAGIGGSTTITSAELTTALQNLSTSQAAVALNLGTAAGLASSAFDTAGAAAAVPRFRGAYANSTAYNVNDLVTNGGALLAATASFTSGSSFNSANWTTVTAAGSSAPCSALGTTTGTCADGGVVAMLQSAVTAAQSLNLTTTTSSTTTLAASTTPTTLFPALTGGAIYHHIKVVLNDSGKTMACTSRGGTPVVGTDPTAIAGINPTILWPDDMGNIGAGPVNCLAVTTGTTTPVSASITATEN